MQHGFLAEGVHDCDGGDDYDVSVHDDVDHADVLDDPRCNDSRRMSMVCEMPEWRSKDLWIETTPPIPPQETSLAWEKEVRNFSIFYGWFFVKLSLYIQVDGTYVKLTLTARGPSLIWLKMAAPPGAFFISPPGPP